MHPLVSMRNGIGVALVACAFLSFVIRGGSSIESVASGEVPIPLQDIDDQDDARFASWVRPSGPPRVALQAGHWKNDEVPEELTNLQWNGAVVAGVHEWEVNLEIAEAAKEIIEGHGVVVDILPTTVPPGYFADAFVSVHADESPDRSRSGFKVASARWDRSGTAGALADAVGRSYGEATGLPEDPNVTSEMRGYYAFNWRRFTHSLHPMTPAMIAETGYLSNAGDRSFVVRKSHVAAQGIADGVLAYLRAQGLLDGDVGQDRSGE